MMPPGSDTPPDHGRKGQFIVTGSANPPDDITRHSGAGRIGNASGGLIPETRNAFDHLLPRLRVRSPAHGLRHSAAHLMGGAEGQVG